MITIGLTTFSEHPLLSSHNAKSTLVEYGAHFPVVELDTSFYYLPQPKTIANWQKQVTSSFQFIIKANQLMTLHDLRSERQVDDLTRKQCFVDFARLMQPLVAANQLKTVLFQMPPFFKRTTKAVSYLAKIREFLPELPIAVEFRNASWYDQRTLKTVMAYLTDLKITLVIADEPSGTNFGVPLVPLVTNPQLAMFRLHGRNVAGWSNRSANWRKQRTLYRYSAEELGELKLLIEEVAAKAQETCIIFNNNSGGDAASNAKQLQSLLRINFKGLAPKQIDLF